MAECFLGIGATATLTSSAKVKRIPDAVFVYDDPLFELLNRTLKDTAREYLTDAEQARKQQKLLLKQLT